MTLRWRPFADALARKRQAHEVAEAQAAAQKRALDRERLLVSWTTRLEWSTSDAVNLSLGRDPGLDWPKKDYERALHTEFHDRLDRIDNALRSGDLAGSYKGGKTVVSVARFLRWAELRQIPVPQDLPIAVLKNGAPDPVVQELAALTAQVEQLTNDRNTAQHLISQRDGEIQSPQVEIDEYKAEAARLITELAAAGRKRVARPRSGTDCKSGPTSCDCCRRMGRLKKMRLLDGRRKQTSKGR